jgi:hypothetical protein
MAQATLTQAKPTPGASVTFQFNPERLTINHQLKLQEMPGQTSSANKSSSSSSANTSSLPMDEVIRQLGITTIKIDKLQFYGTATASACETLLGWSYATKDPSKPEKAVPYELSFEWGALSYNVYMEQVNVGYTKFTGDGIPVRAEVGITMHQTDPPMPGTNPTSGGLPGRRAHVLDGSECLPSVAMAAYGSPSAWRDVARANGIDDPLRVRPGRTLYLPNAQELRRGAGGRP